MPHTPLQLIWLVIIVFWFGAFLGTVDGAMGDGPAFLVIPIVITVIVIVATIITALGLG